MEIIKKVQVLARDNVPNNNGLFRYDFLDLESNLPFTIYSKEKVKIYDNVEFYKVTELKFNLILQKTISSNGNTNILWKVKGVSNG